MGYLYGDNLGYSGKVFFPTFCWISLIQDLSAVQMDF